MINLLEKQKFILTAIKHRLYNFTTSIATEPCESLPLIMASTSAEGVSKV
jgi:hypothetical protein